MKEQQLIRRVFWLLGLLLLLVGAFLVSIIFLNPSSVGNQNFLWFLNLWALIWAFIFVSALVLTFILARTLIRLFFEYQTRHPGSGIKGKLVATFAIFSLFPSLIMFFVAFGLINQNLARWASAPSEQLFESSRIIEQEYYRGKQVTLVVLARQLGRQFVPLLAGREQSLPELRTGPLTSVRVFSRDGSPVYPGSPDSSAPLQQDVAVQVLRMGESFQLEKGINLDSGIVDRGVVRVRIDDDAGEPLGVLEAHFTLPLSVGFHVRSVQQANDVYEGLRGTLASLRTNYLLILSLTTLCVVFGFVWLGNYIARKLTVPLEALAEGSRNLALGNLDYRVDVTASDELGVLVDSFNRMAAQLKESRSNLETANAGLAAKNIQLEQRRRYIETVLQNIATGVLTIDENEVIRTANVAALKILQASRAEIVDRSLTAVADPDLYEEIQSIKKRARLYGTYRKHLAFKRNDRLLHLATTTTASPIADGDRFEYLVVIDDLTELIRAEKFAAWQEVARRLAHEFKNPLTPIQLCAERLKKRFERVGAGKRDPSLEEYGAILEDSTRIITAEVTKLKNLVAEFSRFARLPICRPVPTELNSLVDEAISLYDGRLEHVSVSRVYDPEVRLVNVDPEQIQRVLVNLIDNALDALADQSEARELVVRTGFQALRGSVTVEICDTGVGIGAEDYEHLFLPYFSTKKRGTGLGLAVVRQIVSEHGGFVRAEPNQPRGTRIIFELPAA